MTPWRARLHLRASRTFWIQTNPAKAKV